MTTMKIEKNPPKATAVGTNTPTFFNEPKAVRIESCGDYHTSHLSPGIVVRAHTDMVILKDALIKSKREVPLGKDFVEEMRAPKVQGLPNNRVALLSRTRIRIISSVDGATLYDFDIESLVYPIKPDELIKLPSFLRFPLIDLETFQVSLDNQYLLVSYKNAHDDKETKALIVLIELATGALKHIPVKSAIESFTLMDVGQLLVLYKSKKIETITFDMTSKEEARHQSVSIRNWQFQQNQETRYLYSGWSSSEDNYVVIGEFNCYGGGIWSLNLFTLPRNNNDKVLTHVRAIGGKNSREPTLMPTSLIYTPINHCKRDVMEFSFTDRTSRLLVSFDALYSMGIIAFANFQLGTISSYYDSKSEESIDSLTVYNLTSVEQYKNRNNEALSVVIPIPPLVDLIRDYVNNGFFSVPGIKRTKAVVEEDVNNGFFSVPRIKRTKAVVEEIVENTAATPATQG